MDANKQFLESVKRERDIRKNLHGTATASGGLEVGIWDLQGYRTVNTVHGQNLILCLQGSDGSSKVVWSRDHLNKELAELNGELVEEKILQGVTLEVTGHGL